MTAERGTSGIIKTLARILLGASALVAVSAAPASGETLYEALTATYESNPGLEAERERQRADEENVRQAIAEWLPTVSLDAEHGDEQTHSMPQNSRSHLEPEGYGLTLTQPIFKGFRSLNGKRKADAETQAGQFQLDNIEQTTLLNGVTAYVDVLRDRKIAKLRQDNVRYLQTELKASQVRHRAGDLSKTDVAQARTRVYEGRADLALANAERTASEARYVAVIGHAPGSLVRPPIPDHLLPKTLDEALLLAQDQNPNLESARHLREAAEHEKKQAYGELLPTVSLEAEYNRDYGSTANTHMQEDSSIFLRLQMPLYQGGTIRSRIRQTRAREANRRYEVADTQRQTEAEATDAWQRALAARSRITAARLQVQAAREALKGVRIETEVGERAFFEVLDAQRELVNAQVALARADRDLYVSSYTLLSAVGRLRAHLLGLVDPATVPQPVPVNAHYEVAEPLVVEPAFKAAAPAIVEPQVRGWSMTVTRDDGAAPTSDATVVHTEPGIDLSEIFITTQ